MKQRNWKKKNMKHSIKWIAAFTLALILTFAVGNNEKVLAADISTNMAFNKEYTGTAAGSTKHKYFFTCPTSGRVTISLQTDGARLIWNLLDSSYNEVSSSGWEAGSNRWVFDLEKGTYEFDITTYNDYYVNNYILSARFESAKETYSYENNMYIDVASQASIPFNKKITGQIALNDEKDYYKLVMPTKGTVNFSLLTSEKQSLYLSIRNYKDEQIKEVYFNKDGENFSYTLNKGTYYLCFKKRSNTGNYYFIASYEMNDLTSVTAKRSSYKALKVTAKKSGDITGYQIRYKKGSGSWKTIKVKGNKNLSKTLSVTPADYKVQVRSYYTIGNNTYYSHWSASKKVSCKMKTPGSVAVKNSSSKALKVTAKKSETITGYQIRYKKGSGSWKTIKVKGNKNLNKTIKKLKKGSTYKVQVRTYSTISKKDYVSNWSKVKTVKIKK